MFVVVVIFCFKQKDQYQFDFLYLRLDININKNFIYRLDWYGLNIDIGKYKWGSGWDILRIVVNQEM